MVYFKVFVCNLIIILKELIILKNIIKKLIFYFKMLLFLLNYVVFLWSLGLVIKIVLGLRFKI